MLRAIDPSTTIGAWHAMITSGKEAKNFHSSVKLDSKKNNLYQSIYLVSDLRMRL